MIDAGDVEDEITGRVKWFDPNKGFGFVVPEAGGGDVLLHANVLRNFGQSSVADGSLIRLTTQSTPRGVQAVVVLEIEPPEDDGVAPLADLAAAEEQQSFDELPLEPGRVKWFDKAKGFGFANVFGRSEDIFIHIEVLRRSGLADLQPGEAVALRVIEGNRGRMAVQVAAWDIAARADI